jgi:acyl-coenzyme A synthetase/AMP-(fatty) acid ligase
MLGSALEASAPGHATLSDGRQELAWANVPRAIAELVEVFAAQGIDPRDPVVLECTNSLSGALTLLALLWQGTTVVALPHPGRGDPDMPVPRFATRRLRVRNPDIGTAWRPADVLESHPIECSRPLPVDALLRRGRLILRTSGSLSEPKWVVHTHAGLLQNASNAAGRLGLERTDRVLIPVPLGHMYGLGAAFLPGLLVGASVDLLDGANLVRYLEREHAYRPTIAFLTPNLCSMLLRPRSAPAHYRHIVISGDKLSAPAFHQAEAIYRRVVNLYGSTEMGVMCAGDARHPVASAAVTAGPPLPGVRLRIEPRPDTARDEDGGELLCAHPYGFAGYVDLDGAALAVDPAADPAWYPTRDLVRLHDDGAVEVLGRCDHATNRDGHLVMLTEVERALARLPGIANAAVVLAEPTLRGRAMIAFVCAADGAEVELGRLRRVCRAALPSYAIPDEFRVLPALPLLATGKLDRRALERTIVLPPSAEVARGHGPSPS